jgi:CHRD domain-containing protein
MKKKVAIGSVMVLLVTVAVVLADGGFKRIREFLNGFEEVPAISTTGNGEFRARINKAESEITYSLSYSDLEGTVQQAHIHLGQRGVNGGITVFLCSNLGNGPLGTQPCPASPATITGTITADDVSPNIPATADARAKGLDTGEFDELLRAIRAGATYVNVHSTKWPAGEIRSQIDHEDEHDHDKNDKDKDDKDNE